MGLSDLFAKIVSSLAPRPKLISWWPMCMSHLTNSVRSHPLSVKAELGLSRQQNEERARRRISSRKRSRRKLLSCSASRRR